MDYRWMMRLALAHGTQVARAFERALRAMGVAAPPGRDASDAYAGMAWCFENRGSPMDARPWAGA